MENELVEGLRNTLGEDGTIRFSIRAKNTPKNLAVHDNFRKFAELECNNDYTLALQTLLQSVSEDWKYSNLQNLIKYMQVQIEELRADLTDLKSSKPVTKETKEAF